ncbi:GNAT family N-acetyltransferase [Deinococcus sp. SDU3-2]|uniref:GNAT family N-acetyltransferase n=1 Tax=Deinococcus terrestris TaxID=2651870 RepID=A0A7X1TQ90_9DEIO|nr:GNAT family N-acetyltransferase [Deinococcus terrestris]MPY65186.1 GNAT family N-acetyltransferase [Deinococcus terrestris]
MSIRPFQPEDRAACLALFDSNMPEFFLPHERAEFGQWLGQPFDSGEYGEYFVLEHRGQVMACGGVWLDPQNSGRPAGLSWGMVARKAHRRGYGSALLQFRLKRLRALGATEIHLDTSQHSAPFFARSGFREVRRVPDGYGPGLDRVDMVARLAP